MKQEEVILPLEDQEVRGYLAVPDQGGAGVLLLHAWWGLTPFFKTLCDRLAAAGFIALAPDLYRGRTTATIEEAQQLVRVADADEATPRTVRAAADYLLAHPARSGAKLGVVGFSMGAWWAAQLAALAPEEIGAVVLYYGVVAADFAQASAAFLGHFGGRDDFEPLDGVQAMEQELRAAGRDVSIHVYPQAGHWFCEEDRPDALDPEAADQAWERTLAFLRERLA